MKSQYSYDQYLFRGEKRNEQAKDQRRSKQIEEMSENSPLVTHNLKGKSRRDNLVHEVEKTEGGERDGDCRRSKGKLVSG